jgi:hypothetical protein
MSNAPQNELPRRPKSALPGWAIVVIIFSCLGGTCVLGAPLAIYGVSQYLRHSKTAEALTNLRILANRAKQSYERDRMADDTVKPGAATAITHAFCKSAASPVPIEVPAASKRRVTAADWDGDENTGWSCLQFSIEGAVYFQYAYTATPDSFEVVAHGDLNGDGVVSTFRIRGKAVGEEVTVGQMEIDNEDE